MVTPQTIGFLAAHDVQHADFQGFFGTALQQQLHGEMCDALSQAAIMQAQFPYQHKLLTSVVDFADAAHDANKKEQLLLASRLMDVDWIVLRLSREIVAEAMPYAHAVLSGTVHSATEFFHMAKHPIETCKGLGKSIYFVLETVALNNPEMALEYEQIRNKRNEEIAQAMSQLGHQMANSTGPERLEALTRFGADLVIPGKILHAVGGVCGAIRSQANILRTLEGAVPMLEGLELETAAQEIIQASEKLEIAAQENIAKNLAAELMETENGIGKAGKVASESKVAQQVETVLEKSSKALEDILKNTVPGEVTTGRAKQYIKNGSYQDAIKDFYRLNPSNVQKISGKEGLRGILPDGRNVNVRLESTYKTSTSKTISTPTIEIMKPGGNGTRIKIRYENKL